MTSEIEAIGDVATGGILARAVEPDAGEGRSGNAANCLNCGFALHGNHCHQCGQKAKVHRTLSAFGHDILHSVLHFDGKIWRTLPLLILNPGELTRRYVHGERARFVSPIALFLFTVFLTFAVFNWLMPDEIDFNTGAPVSAEQAAKSLAEDRAELVAGIGELATELKAARAEGTDHGWIAPQIARNKEVLARIDAGADNVRQKVIAERKFTIQKRKSEVAIARLEARLAAAKAAGKPTKDITDELEGERMSVRLMETATGVLQKGEGEKADWKFNLFGSDKLNKAAQHAVENPQLLFYKVQSNAYKYSWALIPISVPFVWLLFFWRREFKMFDHAVFVTYSLCFMMALGTLGGILLVNFQNEAMVVIVTLVLMFMPAIHMYRQLHQAYQTTRFGALWRMIILSNFALTALALFSVLIVTLGVTG